MKFVFGRVVEVAVRDGRGVRADDVVVARGERDGGQVDRVVDGRPATRAVHQLTTYGSRSIAEALTFFSSRYSAVSVDAWS